MKTYLIRAIVRLDVPIHDPYGRAVDHVEASDLSEELKAAWFCAAWADEPDRVEFWFPVRANEDSTKRYSREIELFLSHMPHVEEGPKISVEEQPDNQVRH